jgi:type II secretion system protein N
LAFLSEEVAARVSVWSLLRRAPRFDGYAQMGSGFIDYATTLGFNDGAATVSSLSLDAPDFPAADLLSLGGINIDGPGEVDLSIAYDTEKSVKESTGGGKIAVTGLTISKFTMASRDLNDFDLAGILGKPLALDGALQWTIEGGKAVFKDSTLNAEFAEIHVSGDIALKEPMDRSALRIEIEIKLADDLPPAVKVASMRMADAKGPDGRFHYKVSGTIGNPSFDAQGDGAVAASTRKAGRKAAAVGGAGAADPVDEAGGGGDESAAAKREERKKRREELRARRKSKRGGKAVEEPVDGPEPEEPPDEEPVRDELPIEDPEAPIDEEPEEPPEEDVTE